jgi:hypothetical protein
MITLKQCLTIFFLFLTLTIAPAASHGKGILDILREKGVITEEEYRQAIEEAQGKDKQVVNEAKSEAKAEASKLTKLPDWLSRTSLFGDIRYRHEGFYNSELQANNPTRNRERIRARFGLGVDVSEELSGKLRIVTGDAGDPISTNQTLSELFTRKPINLDWAYITVSPWKTLGLDQITGSEKPMFSLTAGKFPLPQFFPTESELIFDSDLSPEGVNEGVTLWDRPSGFLRNVKVTGIQWSIKEVNNRAAPTIFKTGDAWMFGGQAQVTMAPTDNTKLTFALADYGFQKLDVLARERNTNASLQITNNVKRFGTTSQGGRPVSPVSVGCDPTKLPAGCITGFLGGFNIFNLGTQFDMPTPWQQWPLNFFFDFAHNTEAATNDNSGFWTGFRVGRAANNGDLRFTYTWARTETDAVPSVFSYSDFGRNGGTNVTGHFFGLEYVLMPRLTLSAKEHLVHFIDQPAGFKNPTQSRLQLNLVLSF